MLAGWSLQGGRAQHLATQMCSSEERLLPTRVPLDSEGAGGASSSAPLGRSTVVEVVEDMPSGSAVDGSAARINEDGMRDSSLMEINAVEDAIQIENLEADVPLVRGFGIWGFGC